MRRRLAALLAAALLVAACGTAKHAATTTAKAGPGSATAAAQLFLSQYVDSDGRVVRRDQGGDTVSEGQAYAMLLDVAVGNRVQFGKVWAWSESHLLQPDGLLAWHWSGGKLMSTEPASDADLDVAKALVLAGKKWSDRADLSAGRRYARAILANDTASAGGRLWLVAGTWARSVPLYLDPSYLDPGTFQLLYRVTGNDEWKAIASSSAAALEADTDEGAQLPSDWAQVSASGRVQPAAPPGGGAEVYGYDAFRTLVRQDDECTSGAGAAGEGTVARQGRQLDTKLLGLATRTASAGNKADTYALNGSGAQSGNDPLMLVAAAGAAKAAGHLGAATTYLRDAAEAEAQSGSYYLDAWVALGMTLLTTDRLSPCS